MTDQELEAKAAQVYRDGTLKGGMGERFLVALKEVRDKAVEEERALCIELQKSGLEIDRFFASPVDVQNDLLKTIRERKTV